MPTTVTTQIGSARTFTTPQAWLNSLGGTDLVAADQIQKGVLDPQEFVISGIALDDGALSIASDLTRYVELTSLSPLSVRSNPLYYNTINGAALRVTGTPTNAIRIVNIGNMHFSNLQLNAAAATTASLLLNNANLVQFDNCIIQGPQSEFDSGNIIFNNCAVIATTAPLPRVIAHLGTTLVCKYTTFVVPQGVSIPYIVNYGGTTNSAAYDGCAFFGAGTGLATGNGSSTITYGTCATNFTPPAGTGNVGNLTFASQFISSTNDFRAASGGGLRAGLPISGITTDMAGFTRSISVPTIGAYELAPTGTPSPGGFIKFGPFLGIAAAEAWWLNRIAEVKRKEG